MFRGTPCIYKVQTVLLCTLVKGLHDKENPFSNQLYHKTYKKLSTLVLLIHGEIEKKLRNVSSELVK